MKLSLSWIFDHLVNPLSRYDVADIVDRFNKTTAEIEAWHTINFDKNHYAIGKVIAINHETIIVHCHEWHKDISLSHRSDAHEGDLFVITQQNKKLRWATCVDWHASKEGLLPAVFVTESQLRGSWKDAIPTTDYILEIDNKSITHRPDLWSHQGIAREIGAMLHIPQQDQASSYEPISVVYDTTKHSATSKNPYAFEIQDHKKIKALGGIYIQHIIQRASAPWMAYRLCAVDARPLNLLIDATNYTMYDIGQPLHAFNADAIKGNKVIARTARTGEDLTLLDESTIQLNTHDIVIADTQKPLSLAGIMGGRSSGVSDALQSMILEGACFDAATIRQSAARHKKRTDAAARFEKGLDPHMIIRGIQRYVALLKQCGATYQKISDITALGNYPENTVMVISHSFLEKQLGITLQSAKIIELLSPLEFTVQHKTCSNDVEYTITVPSFRGSKDICIKQDIVEEIGRTLGYNLIKPSTPSIKTTISDLHAVYQQRVIKNICKNSLSLQEVYTYALFDDQFLKRIKWSPKESIHVESPLSENRQQLITTLIPQLLEVVADNAPDHETLQFFELARVWDKSSTALEKKSLAGIVYHKKQSLTFYEGKALLEQLFAELHVRVRWEKINHPEDPWFIPYQSATITHNDRIIGHAGLVHPLFFEPIAQGSAFIFELNADILIAHHAEAIRVNPLAKFPDIVRDISLLIPVTVTVEVLKEAIKAVDPRIISVSLQDFFEKAEWTTHRSVTFRYCMRDQEKTMTKYESDMIHDAIMNHLAHYNAKVR